MIELRYLAKYWKIGLLQALGVTVYCALIALFFNYITQAMQRPGFVGFFLMLTLLVFSATVTGSVVFGYPAYLVLAKSKIREALAILCYTLLFSLIIIVITVAFIISVF